MAQEPYINGTSIYEAPASTYSPRDAERRVMPEEALAAQLITEDNFKRACGVLPPVACGYFVYVRVYQSDPEKKIQTDAGEKTLVTKTLRAINDEKYSTCAGLVISVGPQAYTGNNFDGTPRYPGGPWCKVGDWVIIPRLGSDQISYGATREQMVPLMILADDKIMGIVPDPKFVIATHVLDQDGR